ncbi:MAG TPA: hypothetical protein VHO03_03060 [Ignavibacteriales bacterium]|nr:hypothetical protein [Ignavibacteriales bacterium]
MKAYLLRVFMLLILLVYYFANISILSHDFVYAENFDGSVLSVKPWIANAGYTVNYLGITSEKKFDGRKTLKFDVTLHGDSQKECYYYWVIPLKVRFHGDLKFSASLWADTSAEKLLSMGFSFIYPPAQSRYNSRVSRFNRWASLSGSITEDQLLSESSFYNSAFLASSYSTGHELERFGIFIRGKGEHRLTFYLGKLELKGRTYNISDLQKYLKKQWMSYFSRSSLASESASDPGNLPSIPDLREKTLSPIGQRVLNELYEDRNKIERLYDDGRSGRALSSESMSELGRLLNNYPSKVELLKTDAAEPEEKAMFFSFPATKFNRLDGMNLPDELTRLKKLSARGTPDEYLSLTFLLQPKGELKNVKMNWSSFTSSSLKTSGRKDAGRKDAGRKDIRTSGKSLVVRNSSFKAGSFKNGASTIDASALDVSIAKVWFQAGVKSTQTNKKILTQELLVKNDSLIRVNYLDKTNYLLIRNSSGKKKYIDISSPEAALPQDAVIEDSKTLLPFSLDGKTNRQIWLTMHIPQDAKPGKYTSTFRVSSSKGTLIEFPLEIEVLPFKLDEPRIKYSLYYHGALRDWKLRPFNCMDKTPEELYIDLKDMKEHGVLYPNNYQDLKHLEENLTIRDRVGLPKDRFYSTLLDWFKGPPMTKDELGRLKKRILDFKSVVEKYGYKQLYIYGEDEARGQKLLNQRAGWQLAHELGVKIFVAGYDETFQMMGDMLDLAVIQGPLKAEQAHLYHSKGNEIYSYSNPQVGQENPEIYRRNYGLALWKAGYDGCMDYAYQKNYNSMWNDFDYPRYREETFTYPTSNGLISTVQWEGFRQGITDVRYMSTLLNRIDSLKADGKNVSALERWVGSIDTSGDLDEVREEITDKILSIKAL